MKMGIGKYYLHCSYDDLDQKSFHEVVFITSLGKESVEYEYVGGSRTFSATREIFEGFYKEVDKNLVDIMRIME